MVARSRSSLRRPTLRGSQKSRSPSNIPVVEPQQVREESTKRTRVSSLVEQHDRFQKRRKITNNLKSPQVQIPLRGKIPPKLVSPKTVTQPVLLPIQSQTLTPPLDSPKTQYDQIRFIEEKARVAIRGGGFRDNRDDKRSLRSQDGGSRSKSELAQYFNNYEQMLSLEPTASDQLTAQTRIILVDDTPGFQPQSPARLNSRSSDPFGASKPLHDAQRIDLSKYVTNARRFASDPLGPEVFLKIHKKEERRAKQIRNSEREKAQHEKVQLERLLDELRGPDWLRTMGISGITETEKKKYEPKRILFIEEIKAIIDKFRQLKELEKEQKRRELQPEEDEEDDADDEAGEDDDANEADGEDDDEDGEEEEQNLDSTESSLDQNVSDANDVDALAARQLLQEANSAHKPRKKVVEPPPPPLEPPPHKPFTSFYDKRHVRDAAIGKHGRRSRGVSAFGQPVPELEDKDFELPDSILTEDAIRAGQRRRRRLNREAE